MPNAIATEKTLPLCASSPNCVSSQASSTDTVHYIPPFSIKGDVNKAWEALKNTLKNQPRTLITHSDEISLHAEATTRILRFVDDLDAILDREAKLIHIRSASRVGYSDLGVNRNRIEKLRKLLLQQDVIAS